MEKLNIKQNLELEILIKKTKNKHFLLSTLENNNKNHFINKKLILPFFKILGCNKTKFPLYLHILKNKAESIKNIKRKKASLIVLDNFILKKNILQQIVISEEKVITLLKEATSNLKRGNLF